MSAAVFWRLLSDKNLGKNKLPKPTEMLESFWLQRPALMGSQRGCNALWQLFAHLTLFLSHGYYQLPVANWLKFYQTDLGHHNTGALFELEPSSWGRGGPLPRGHTHQEGRPGLQRQQWRGRAATREPPDTSRAIEPTMLLYLPQVSPSFPENQVVGGVGSSQPLQGLCGLPGPPSPASALSTTSHGAQMAGLWGQKK